MNFLLLSLIIGFWPVGTLRALDRTEAVLLFPEWQGAPAYLATLKKENVPVCSFLKKMAQKYSDTYPVVQRVMLTRKEIYCADNLETASKHLGSSEAILRATALELGASLPQKEKNSLSQKVADLNTKETDQLVKKTLTKTWSK